MNFVSALRIVVFGTVLFGGLNANPTRYYEQESSLDAIDREALDLIRAELEDTKKVLIAIQNSQNPAMIKAAASSVGGAFKELLYIASAVALGGGSIVAGLALIMGQRNFNALLQNPTAQGITFIALPIAAVSMIFTYIFLKLVFGRLLASSPQDAHHIKESLADISKTIHKLNYEIKKIERLGKLAN